MQSVRFYLTTLLILAGFNAAHPSSAMAYDFTPLEAAMNKAVSDSVFPGASLAILYKGKVVFHKAFGRMTYDPHSTAADTTTIYDLASLTKALATTSIAMQLVERDSLNLQSPVSRYLHAFSGKGKEKITIEHLLRHTSGLRAHSLFAKTCSTPEQLFIPHCYRDELLLIFDLESSPISRICNLKYFHDDSLLIKERIIIQNF